MGVINILEPVTKKTITLEIKLTNEPLGILNYLCHCIFEEGH